MFTLNANDLQQVANAKEVEKTAAELTEKKANQCVVYGSGAVLMSLAMGFVLATVFKIQISDMLLGCSLLPIIAFIALRTAYIKTIYHDGLISAAFKTRQNTNQ